MKHTSNYDESILEFLSQNGEVRRITICEELGLKWTTVYDHLKRLELCGAVRKATRRKQRRARGTIINLPGRPYTMWSVIHRDD